MRKTINRVKLVGKVYDHNLAMKVTGATSKNPGTNYIGGSLDIATDEDCLNVVTVNYTYVAETTKTGSKNSTYTALKNIIEGGKTVVAVGADEATCVTVDTALALNDFYSEKAKTDKNPNGLVSAKRCDGGFITINSKLADGYKNNFECDMLINGTIFVEADPEKHIDADFLRVKGATFNFRGDFMPVEFVVKSAGGIKYFESLEATTSNLVFTKVWGEIKSQTIVDKREEENAFGEPAVKEYTRNVREWIITGSAKEPYEIGDENNGITLDEVKQAMAARETYLAEVKARQDEYQASKAAAASTSASSFSNVNAGSFNF